MKTLVKSDLLKLYDLPLLELIEIASKVTDENFSNDFEFCSIISAKTGKCSQNCKYCAQSSHYRTDIETHPLVPIDDVKKAALSAKDNGANRFSIVTSGKTPELQDFQSMCDMVNAIESIDGLSACASIGFLTYDQAVELKKAGLKRYHHNINTCSSYYPDICTTHSFQDRLDTIDNCKKAGLEICCGVILGMGETREQRIEMAIEIAQINPEAAPLNFLDPIEGTPFGDYIDKIDEEEIIKTIAIFRIALPKLSLRYAGGRLKRLSRKYQELGIKAGIDSILIGNLLTTIGITPKEDIEMVSQLGKKLVR